MLMHHVISRSVAYLYTGAVDLAVDMDAASGIFLTDAFDFAPFDTHGALGVATTLTVSVDGRGHRRRCGRLRGVGTAPARDTRATASRPTLAPPPRAHDRQVRLHADRRERAVEEERVLRLRGAMMLRTSSQPPSSIWKDATTIRRPALCRASRQVDGKWVV